MAVGTQAATTVQIAASEAHAEQGEEKNRDDQQEQLREDEKHHQPQERDDEHLEWP